MDILEYSNNKKLQQMKCELQEWQEKEEAKMRRKNPWGEPRPLGRSAAGHSPGTFLSEAIRSIFSLLRQRELLRCTANGLLTQHLALPGLCVFIFMGIL